MEFQKLADRFVAAFNVKKVEPEIAVVDIKFVLKGEKIPEAGAPLPQPRLVSSGRHHEV
jgi:hypothetical protein